MEAVSRSPPPMDLKSEDDGRRADYVSGAGGVTFAFSNGAAHV